LRATRPPAQRVVDEVVCPSGRNHSDSPKSDRPASFKRLLGGSAWSPRLPIHHDNAVYQVFLADSIRRRVGNAAGVRSYLYKMKIRAMAVDEDVPRVIRQ